MLTHDPYGASDPDSIIILTSNEKESDNFIYFFDQEPVHLPLHESTFEKAGSYSNLPSQKRVFVTSEVDSIDVERASRLLNAQSFYYFFHGWAALDWYRGYDRTFLIPAPEDRHITKTFISPNRIIGGLRKHRVIMIYYFQKLGLMHNWISAPKHCPAEQKDILEIALPLKNEYPDIIDVLSQANLPMTFPGETTQEMHSCCLSLFDQCKETLIYHVSETVYFGQKHHLTEKIFKPICLGMPFIISSTHGSLQYLRSYGFKTFHDVWDESYDDEVDDHQRLNKIALLLKELDQLSTEEKQEMFNRCLPIIKHNFEHFYSDRFEKELWSELTQMFESINAYIND